MLQWILRAFGLGIGLSMDACAISMSNGLSEPNMKKTKIFMVGLFCGFFQFLMPLIGFLSITLLDSILGGGFTTTFSYLIPWIALIALSYLGIKMIVEAVKRNSNEESEQKRTLSVSTLLVQAIVTSIDAFSVGLILANYKMLEAFYTFIVIGIITFILSVVSVYIGKKFGLVLKKKSEIIGGSILVIIGLEIFFTNFNDVIDGIKTLFNL